MRLCVIGVVAGDVVDSAAQSVPVSCGRRAGHGRAVRPVRVSTTVFVLRNVLVRIMIPHTSHQATQYYLGTPIVSITVQFSWSGLQFIMV